MPVDFPALPPDSAPLSSRYPDASGNRHMPPGTLTTDSLFRGRQEILLDHNGDQYRLRITRTGKLILTK